MLALIDDWGNPVPGRGSTDWFGFSEILLLDSEIDRMRSCHQMACQCLGRRNSSPLHFTDLNLNSKYHITRLLAQENPIISIVAVHIHDVTSSQLRQRGWAYRYYGKEMIRVATHFAQDNGENVRVIFHRHEYLEGIEDYILNKLQSNPWYIKKISSKRIVYDKLQDMRSIDDEDEPLLGFADCIAHACYHAFNPNPRWRQTNPTCLNILSDCIWRGPSYDENIRRFGVILEPGGIPTSLISSLPYGIRQHWE